jgi:hypothetical protein
VIENHSGSKWDYIYIWDYGIMMGGIWFFHSLPFRRNGIVYTLPRRRRSRKRLQSRRYLFRRNGIVYTLPRRRISRKCLKVVVIPFRRNGINTLSRRRMIRKCLQGRRYSVQEEWYSIHASQKKDEQEMFTRSSLFRSGGMVYTRFPEEG